MRDTAPMGFDTFFAALGLLACLGLAVHMALGPVRQHRVNNWFARRGWLLRAWWQSQPWRRGDKRLARDVAAEAIRRAKSGGPGHGEWDGNVYFPKRFEERRKKRKLH